MEGLKKKFYLIVASYFAFWARLVLHSWQPEVILVTGSSGKTTVFRLLEAQLGSKAEYAYHSNSAFGIPFNILGLERHTYSLAEWLKFFVLAPFRFGVAKNRAKLYVVEADAERPGEADFIQRLLQPKTVIVTNIFQTHSAYFDELVTKGQYFYAIEAVAAEFVKYLRGATKRAIINADNQLLFETVEKTDLPKEVRDCMVYLQAADYLREYKIYSDHTQFVINGQTFNFPYFLPQEVAMGIEITRLVCEEFGIRMRRDFDNYQLEPGRSSLFAGIRETTLIDSTYNANLGSALAMLKSFRDYPADKKWLVLGEFRELGREAELQHTQLAQFILDQMTMVEQVVLVSPEMREWVYPLLSARWGSARVQCFDEAAQAYAWIYNHLQGGETLLIKASQGRHLEAIVEGLLADPADAAKLSCRQAIYRPIQERILQAVKTNGQESHEG
ncbi:hypothetical protein IJJ08_05190 [bacterium]|nr:hypothetical protein [bacterium]